MKTQIILAMLHSCIEYGNFSADVICSNFNISKRTLARYVSEVNCYFANNYHVERLIYDRSENVYMIKSM